MPTIDRAEQLATDFYVFSGKPRLPNRIIASKTDISGFAVVLATDADAAYLADTRLRQLLIFPASQQTDDLTPGTVIEPSGPLPEQYRNNPDALVDAGEDITAAFAYALAREAQRNGESLTAEQAAMIEQADALLRSIADAPAPRLPAADAAAAHPAPIVSQGGSEVGVELTALQVNQLLSQQISDPADVRAALHRLEEKHGGIQILDGRAELLYSDETKTYIAAMEPRDKQAFDANLTTLQATATPSADDIEADAMDEAAEQQGRTL